MNLRDRGIYYYNDYELLYLASSKIDEAIDILIWKYSFLIKSRISSLHIDSSHFDDYFQEGLIILMLAVRKYDEHQNSRFTSFFDLLLKRRLVSVLRKDIKSMQVEKKEIVECNILEETNQKYVFNGQISQMLLEETPFMSSLSNFEKKVYDEVFRQNQKVSTIACKYNTEVKRISNTKQRVIKKIQRYLKIKKLIS